MDSRKIVAFGKNSYIVSLPISWVKENKLGKGDSVYVDALGDELKITARENEEKTEPTEIIIDTKNKDLHFIETEIVSAYLKNYDIIAIKGDNLQDTAVDIKNIVHNLAGLEILEQTKSKIMVRYLLDTKEISIETLVRRIDIICRSIIDDSIHCSSDDEYEGIYQRDMDINRLVFLAYRVMRSALLNPRIAKSMRIHPIDVLTNWEIVMRLEKIGDQSKRVARHLRKLSSKKIRSEIVTIYNEIKKDYADVMKAYYTKDDETAYRVATSAKKRVSACYNFLEKNHNMLALYIMTDLKSMVSYVKHIARSVIGNK